MRAAGAHAASLVPIFPSVTYPNHVALVTGVRSARHGVLNNTIFYPDRGITPDWYFEDKWIQVPTLWKKAKSAGLSTAIIRWPGSVGSGVDWYLPEIFYAPGIDPVRDWELVKMSADPTFLSRIKERAGIAEVKSIEDWDILAAAGAELMLERKEPPQLLMMHFIQVDFAQHNTGRDSVETRAALWTVDGFLKRILSKVDFSETLVLIVGDHGFIDYDHVIYPNALFANHGWLRGKGKTISEWKVVAHPDGAQAAIYLNETLGAKKAAFGGKVIDTLEANSGGRYRILRRKELDALAAYPDALCAVEANPGYIFSAQIPEKADEWVVKTKAIQAHHGHMPTREQVHSGMLAAGAGVRPGSRLPSVGIIDIAPTVAKALGFELPDAEGRPLELAQ